MSTTKQISENSFKRCREGHITTPTYKQMRNPELIPEKIKSKLKTIGLWGLNSLNLYRTSGALGAIGYLRRKFTLLKVCSGGALQYPTPLYNGYGAYCVAGI